MQTKDEKRLLKLAKDRESYKLNPQVKKDRVKDYKLKNAEKIKIKNAEYRKKRKENDPIYFFTERIRRMILYSFNTKNLKKTNKTTEILGCNFGDFKQHIESLFEDWMNWNNRGNSKIPKTKWNIDHIIPLATAKNEEDIIRLNHYTNLRPLCSKENRDKGDTII